MRVPLSWLREFVDVDLPVQELAHRLTMAGLEVEEIEYVGADWRDVAIGRVTEIAPHPRADNLQVVTLDRGAQPTTVVTAAPNVTVGTLVPHVAPGGRLPGGDIGERTFQGIASAGMLCSGYELDISADRDGIYLLEADAPVGQDLAAYLDEVILDVYITPNRPDCMSIVGIAREVHALTGAPLRLPRTEPPHGPVPASDLVGVRIDDPEGCPRFTATVVQGTRVGPSPQWLQRRLHFAGVRALSNAVDVTNYVMLELGQPLHAFDRQRLRGSIVVRRAAPGERLTTLDGEERTLTPDMMIVADEQAARSVAGVMGGLDSEIGDDTTEIVLEGANWDRASIRRASSALNLASEASRRFGRGVDPDLTAQAVSRAAELTVTLAGGQAASGLVDVYPGRSAQRTIDLTTERVDGLLGASYSTEQIADTLTSLGFGVESEGERLRVTVPGHRRFDVERSADLVEEVARIIGYERIPSTMPAGRVPEPRPAGDAGYTAETLARRTLAAAGLQEVITYSLVDPALGTRLDADAAWPPSEAPAISPLAVANPLSVEQSVLRSTLLGSLLDTLRSNLRRQERVLLFELARTWREPFDPLPIEERKVGLALTGPRDPLHWSGQSAPLDFFDLKGMVDALCRAFGLTAVYEAHLHPALHPGRSARLLIDGQVVGMLGQLHPRVAERFDLEDRDVLVAELSFESFRRPEQAVRAVETPSRYPSADRDIAIVLDEGIRHADVESAIREAGAPLLRSVRLFDVYRGGQIPPGRKSLAYTLAYQAPDRTLGDEEVAETHARVETRVREQFGAEVRGR